MTQWASRFIRTANGTLLAIMLLTCTTTLAVTARYVIEFGVNSTRDTSFWVEYYIVKPVRPVFKLGVKPSFFSHSEWHEATLASWPDVMYCTDIEGPNQGLQRRLGAPVSKNLREPGRSGFYDDEGYLMEDSTPGVWEWEGAVPRYESDCTMKPWAHLFPSPLVHRVVDIPATSVFHFRRDPELPL